MVPPAWVARKTLPELQHRARRARPVAPRQVRRRRGRAPTPSSFSRFRGPAAHGPARPSIVAGACGATATTHQVNAACRVRASAARAPLLQARSARAGTRHDQQAQPGQGGGASDGGAGCAAARHVRLVTPCTGANGTQRRGACTLAGRARGRGPAARGTRGGGTPGARAGRGPSLGCNARRSSRHRCSNCKSKRGARLH